MQFEYSDTDTISDVEYPDSDTDGSKLLETDSILSENIRTIFTPTVALAPPVPKLLTPMD